MANSASSPARPPRPSPPHTTSPIDPEGRRPSRANVARGRWGEDLACRWYERHGYEVVARNWRTRAGELDLVAVRGDLVAFVEVKARRTTRHGPAAASVTPLKQRRIRTAARGWLTAHRSDGGAHFARVRFDVVAITGTKVEVITAAF